MYFNSSREEMELANEDREDAVETSQGGYQTALSVYHDLHCLVGLFLRFLGKYTNLRSSYNPDNFRIRRYIFQISQKL